MITLACRCGNTLSITLSITGPIQVVTTCSCGGAFMEPGCYECGKAESGMRQRDRRILCRACFDLPSTSDPDSVAVRAACVRSDTDCTHVLAASRRRLYQASMARAEQDEAREQRRARDDETVSPWATEQEERQRVTTRRRAIVLALAGAGAGLVVALAWAALAYLW